MAWTDPPWNVVFFGLSEKEAKTILRRSRKRFPKLMGEVVAPGDALSLGLDRDTAETLLVALGDKANFLDLSDGSGRELVEPSEARARLDALTDTIQDFLAIEPPPLHEE